MVEALCATFNSGRAARGSQAGINRNNNRFFRNVFVSFVQKLNVLAAHVKLPGSALTILIIRQIDTVWTDRGGFILRRGPNDIHTLPVNLYRWPGCHIVTTDATSPCEVVRRLSTRQAVPVPTPSISATSRGAGSASML